ncbi:MAG: glutamyl-tRNA reductase [Candidatus Methanoplasma sp.]|jgi:glutamyl-tRNA reductase|nr:glutamyl-tRNA reductase [Candidatus Methanoplasma sp.]
MIVSVNLTYVSAGLSALTDAVPLLERSIMPDIKHSPDVSGYVCLKTCNRFEVYIDSKKGDVVRLIEPAVKEASTTVGRDGAAFVLKERDSAAHLFRVCCGLDSLIVGEDQIQGQVRQALADSRIECNSTSKLDCLFEHALKAGKRVRTETELNRGSVSVGSAAVDLSERIVGSLEGKSVTIVGAGETANIIGKCLRDKGIGATFVSNRTYDKARELAEELGGTAVELNNLYGVMSVSDIVIVATSAPHKIINFNKLKDGLSESRRKLLIVDLSVPRNVDERVADMEFVNLVSLDGLRSIAEENLSARKKEIPRAETIIAEELQGLSEKDKEAEADGVIRDISLKMAAIREYETEVAIKRAGSSSDISSVIDDLSRVLVSRIMADTYERLRAASREGNIEMCRAAEDLFGIGVKKDVS